MGLAVPSGKIKIKVKGSGRWHSLYTCAYTDLPTRSYRYRSVTIANKSLKSGNFDCVGGVYLT